MSSRAKINNQSVTPKKEMLAVGLAEVTDAKTIKKWMGRAAKSIGKSSTSLLQFGLFGSECRYFEAWIDGKPAGYIRITNNSRDYKGLVNYEVWHAAEIYVLSAFPEELVSFALLYLVIQEYGVKTTMVDAAYYEKNKENIYSLGFRRGVTLEDRPDTQMLVTEDLAHSLSQNLMQAC